MISNFSKSIILGSSSPRRVELLKYLGLKIDQISPDIDENLTDIKDPKEFVRTLSLEKAKHIISSYPNLNLEQKILLTADTIVVLEQKIIGKPRNKANAIEILKELSNKTHTVYTSVSYTYLDSNSNKQHDNTLCETQVTFNELDDREIDTYTDTKEPYDKAGCYAIQGSGAFMIREINGSFTNVMGLPLAETANKLKKLNDHIK